MWECHNNNTTAMYGPFSTGLLQMLVTKGTKVSNHNIRPSVVAFLIAPPRLWIEPRFLDAHMGIERIRDEGTFGPRKMKRIEGRRR
jgi:hypothetical protein